MANPLQDRLDNLQSQTQGASEGATWGAEVYDLCEEIWKACGLQHTHLSLRLAQDLANFLNQHPSALAIAHQAIHQLRSESSKGDLSSSQRCIVDETASLYHATRSLKQGAPTSLEKQLWNQEKDLLDEVRFHKARLLLPENDRFGPGMEAKIRAWLEQRPRGSHEE